MMQITTAEALEADLLLLAEDTSSVTSLRKKVKEVVCRYSGFIVWTHEIDNSVEFDIWDSGTLKSIKKVVA